MWAEWLEATLERSPVVAERSDARERLQRVETLMNDDDVEDENASAWAGRRLRADALD